MKGLHGKRRIEDRDKRTWTRGVISSLLFHVLLFSLVLFVPDSMPTRKMGGGPAVYEVNLVEMPSGGRSARPAASEEKTGKEVKEVSTPKAVPAARRIAPPVAKEEKPVVISKREVERKKEEKKETKKPPQPEVSPSKLIDGAISKIEKKVKTDKPDHLSQALSKVEGKVKAEKGDHLAKALSQIESRAQGQGQGEGQGGYGEGGTERGITMRMYELAVQEQIKSNWSYPVDFLDPKKLKDLEAIVVVKVREDGTILKSWFTQRSSSSIFDGSVIKAIERSDPLPPFPEGYKRSTDEIEIKFDLSEMEEF